MAQSGDELLGLLLRTMQSTLVAIGEFRSDIRGNREAMLQRTGDMMERFDQRIEDLAARFDDRIEGLATEVFHRFSRHDHRFREQDRRIQGIERCSSTRTSRRWGPLMLISIFKTMTFGQGLGLLGALILGLLGFLTPGEIKAILLSQFGLRP